MHLRTLIAALMLGPTLAAATGSVESSFMYRLSDFSGPTGTSWAALAYDRHGGEVHVVEDGRVRVFDGSGMEVYRYGGDDLLGYVLSVAPLADGDLFALVRKDAEVQLWRCDFRGRPDVRFELAAIPSGFGDGFAPNAIATNGRSLHVADLGSMKVLVLELDGSVRTTLDVAGLLGFGEAKRRDTGMSGFSVDLDGNLLFTVATAFTAHVVSPRGEIRTFGSAGSTPGRFNIVGGIASDQAGNLFVTDVLRSVVMVFDRKLEFLHEFGHRGSDEAGLNGPRDVVAAGGRVFVSQNARRGVSVFRISIGTSGRGTASGHSPPRHVAAVGNEAGGGSRK
jgi:hypothetical protein